MADNLESIGGVKVDIRGDFSDLPADFEAAIKIAVDSGHTLAEAIAMATKAPDTTAAQTAIAGIGTASTTAAQQLGLFASSFDGIPFADATGQLNIFTDELETFKGASQTAAQAAIELERNIAHAGEASGQAGGAFNKFAESVGEFISRPMQAAGAGVTSFLEKIGPMGAAAGATGVILAELGKNIFELVKQEGAAAEATENMAYRLNLSFQQTRELSEMAQVAGVNIEILTRVSMRLADAMGDAEGAGKKVRKALDDIGVVTTDSGEAMVQMLQKLAEIPDAGQRIAEAHKIMGRGAVELEPLLRQYDSLKQAVQSLGGALDGDMVKSLTKADDAIDRLGIAFSHLKQQAAAEFAPAITAAVNALTSLISTPPPDALAKQITDLTADIADLKKEAENAKGAVAGVFAASTGMVGPEVTASMIAAKEAQLDLIKGQKEAIERSKEYNDELDKSNRANQKWAAANKAALEESRIAWEKFHDSAIGALNAFPTSYTEYLDKLEQGGAKASASVGSFDKELDKAKQLMLDLKGEPLNQLIQFADRIDYLRDRAQRFAETDAFLKASVQISTLLDKFPVQAEELKAMGLGFDEFVARIQTVAANVPETKGWERDIQLIKQDIETRKQFDDESQKLQRTLTRGWETYETAARKAAGITSDIKQAINDLEPDWTKLWASFPEETQAGFQSAMELRAALKALGYDAAEGQGKIMALFDKVATDGRASLEQVEFAWSRVSGQVMKLAQTNLPAAIEKFDEYIVALKAGGAAIGYIYQLEEQRLNLEIKDAEQRGKDATAQLIHLQNIKIAQQILIDQSSLLGDMYIGLMKDFDNAFGAASRGIANNIIDQKNWGDVFSKTIDDVAKQILNTLIGTAFKALEDAILKNTGLLQGMANLATKGMGLVTKALGLGGLPKIPGGGGSAAGAASSGSGEVAQEGSGLPGGGAADLSGEAESLGGAATKGGGSSGGGGAGSFGGVMSIATLGVQIATGISQGIQNSRMINLLGEIEISTRQCKEQLIHLQGTFNTYLPQLVHLTDIWAELNSGTLAQVRDVLWWGIVNVNVAGQGQGSLGVDARDLGWAKGEQDKRNAAAQGDQTTATEAETVATTTLTTATELATNSMRNLHETALKSTTALANHTVATNSTTEAVKANTAVVNGPTFSGIDEGVSRMQQQDALDYFAKQLRQPGTFTTGDGLASLAAQAGISLEAAKAMVAAMQPKWDAMLAVDKEHLKNIADSTRQLAILQKEMDARAKNPPQDPGSVWAAQQIAAQQALVISTRNLEATIGAWQQQFLGQSVGRDPQATAAASAALTQQIADAIAKSGLGPNVKVQGYAGSYQGTGAFSSGTLLQRPDFSVTTPSTGFTSPTIPSAPAQQYATITVNALNPSSRGVTQALVDGMQQAGLRTK